MERQIFMVNVNQFSGCVFVKDYDFYVSQGGLKESWGEHWIPIMSTSIEAAREAGCELPGAKPYTRQAK